MRIVTRPDFDGIVCAVLIREAENITQPIYWVEPYEVQSRAADIRPGDILANLPYDARCSYWFDHHYSNRLNVAFKGSYKIAPSAAGVVYKYYQKRLHRDYSELIRETDRIDSADLTLDEVLHPAKYPYVLLSMTIISHDGVDEPYWNDLVNMLAHAPVDSIIQKQTVKDRCTALVNENKAYHRLLTQNTVLKDHVSITDFRSLGIDPAGNRFLVYSLFPESVVNIKIRYDDKDRENVTISVGHSIFNRRCNVNVGSLLAQFGGGGHPGAGGCRVHASQADGILARIETALLANESGKLGAELKK